MNEMKMRMGGGTDIAQLAEMIRRMGRGDDKILAHITPQEAVMLKEQGGSGTVNPLTGLPEFQEEYDPNIDIGFGPGEFTPPTNPFSTMGMEGDQFERFTGEQPMFTGEGSLAPQNFQPFQYGEANMTGGFEPRMSSYDMPDVAQEYQMAAQQAAEPSGIGGRQVAPIDDNIFKRTERGLQDLRKTLDKDYPTLTRIGGAGANLVAQALLARRANRAREAEAGRLRERAQPFRAAEQEAMSRAQGGGLTPQQAREMEIAQARARQGLSAGNQAAGSAAAGILAGQATRARSAARQESLETALQLAGIADRYERQAIQEELARDQELAQLFASVIGKEIQAASRTQAPQGAK
jgi:hypothetical protein